MKHKLCECNEQTDNCPRYGWMKGRKWNVCQFKEVSAERRDELLDAYEHGNTLKNSDPGILQKAVNLTKSTVNHALDGFAKASPQLKRIRLEVCNMCDQLTPERTCRACGCPVEDKADRRSEKCPLAKWPGDADAPSGCGCRK